MSTMKKYAIILLTIIIATSCSLFKKPTMTQEEINALVNEKAELKEELEAAEQELQILRIQAQECADQVEKQSAQTTQTSAPTGEFYVIAGSFTKLENAESYAKKIQQEGGSGDILNGPGGFKFVAYSSHSGIRAAINQMMELRQGVSKDAWVYADK